MSANQLTAVATPVSSRIGERFTIHYEDVRRQPKHRKADTPVIIVPSQEIESVHIGADKRRHYTKQRLHLLTAG